MNLTSTTTSGAYEVTCTADMLEYINSVKASLHSSLRVLAYIAVSPNLFKELEKLATYPDIEHHLPKGIVGSLHGAPIKIAQLLPDLTFRPVYEDELI